MITDKIKQHLKNVICNEHESLDNYIREIREEEQLITVRLKGKIDAYSIPIIEEQGKIDGREAVNKNILADFKDVERVDSATLASLITLFKDLKANYRKLGIINPTAYLEEYIKINKISDIITVYPSEEEARKELAGVGS